MRIAVLSALVVALVAAAPWPAPDAPLVVAPLPPKLKFERPIRIAIDPGHGAPGNRGNRGVNCEEEGVHMRQVAERLAAHLASTGRFVVIPLRTGDETPRYADRIARAKARRAEAIVSLHSDARGAAAWWWPDPKTPCLRNDAEPGLGVLISDEGPVNLVAKRRRLATALMTQLVAAGFPAYGGADWELMYDLDAAPGVYVDRREPKRTRVFMLRQREVPTVIVETHHALDFEESARWREARTWEAFSAAVAAGLVEALRR